MPSRCAFFLLFLSVRFLSSTAAEAAPFQKILAQRQLPAAEKPERFQTGFIRVGHFLKNDGRAAAARPDGTGTAYNLYQIYYNDTYPGRKVNFLADTLFLSDREKNRKFSLSQFNYYLGLAMKGPDWDLQFGREEDLPMDSGGVSYRYWDARASLSGTTGESSKSGGPGQLPAYMKPKGAPFQLKYTLMAGYFLHNNSYPARPDRSAVAQVRYRASAEATERRRLFWLVGAVDFLTEERHAVKPVGMEVSYGLAVKGGGVETAIVREYRKTLDGPGYFPYYMLRLTYAFDSRGFGKK